MASILLVMLTSSVFIFELAAWMLAVLEAMFMLLVPMSLLLGPMGLSILLGSCGFVLGHMGLFPLLEHPLHHAGVSSFRRRCTR